jgi:hypothetical protein
VDDYDIRKQQVVERALAAKLGLWGALLTSHTVMLSVTVALLVAVKPAETWPFRLIGFIAVVCMLLVLLNPAQTKSQYELIGKRLVDPEAEPKRRGLATIDRLTYATASPISRRSLRRSASRLGLCFSRGRSQVGERDAQPSVAADPLRRASPAYAGR